MPVCLPNRWATLKDRRRADKPAVRRGHSARFREHHLTYVDISGQEPGLAIGEVILPQPPEAIIEARRRQGGPGRAEIASPDRKRPGIILPENALADNGNA